VKHYAEVVFPAVCGMPLDPEEIRSNRSEYEQAGLPGCVGIF